MEACDKADEILYWFKNRWGCPTPAQQCLWPVMARGHHALLSAPTGTGKTLAALLPIWQELTRRPTPGLQALYIAPLRALCHDLELKLTAWLAELKLPLGAAALTGDTPVSRRRRLREDPPALLVTTPESLALWLSHGSAAATLRSLRFVVVDEVHALAGNKRGADLAVSLERVARAARHDPQRIGLSATISPLAAAAAWLGGGRDVTLIHLPGRRDWRLDIEHLPAAVPGRFLAELLPRLEARLADAATSIVFTNVRSLAERLAWLLRRRWPGRAEQIAVHHSALATQRRRELEQRLFRGELWAVVSSTSLEAGIDVGSVDQVIMIHPPGGATRLLQRLGRAHHRPGGRPRGVIFTTQTDELLEAVVTRAAGQDRCLEPLAPPRHPLDVLCQQLVGLAIGQRHTAAGAYHLVRGSHPYRDLSLADFAGCLDYLTGGHRNWRTAARLRFIDHQLCPCDQRLARLYRQNAGTIQAEPTTTIHGGEGQPLGTVSSGFADGLKPGDRLLLGGRSLQVEARRGGELHVAEVAAVPRFTRWLDGGLWAMSLPLARRLWRFRVRLRDALIDGDAHDVLQREYALDAALADAVLADLELQEQVSEIPADDLLVESVVLDGGEAVQHALHLPLPPAAAEAVGQVVVRRLFGHRAVPVLPGGLGCLLFAPADLDLSPASLRSVLSPLRWEQDLRSVSADHPALGKRFHAAATNGLMLLRQPIGQRVRVGGRSWAAGRLLRWLRTTDPNSALFQQALRETQEEVFHLEAVLDWLADLPRRAIRQRWLSEPSPLTARWSPVAPPPDHDLETALLASAIGAT